MFGNLLAGLNVIYGPVMFLAAIAVAVFMARTNIGKSASEAQANAIAALKEEMDVQKSRIDSLKEENRHHEIVIQTICAALKSRGIYISIDGDAVHIRDNGHSTTILMKKED